MEQDKFIPRVLRVGAAVALAVTMAGEARAVQASGENDPRIVGYLCYAITGIINGGGEPVQSNSVVIVGKKQMNGYVLYTLGFKKTPENEVTCKQIKDNRGRVSQ